MENGQHIKHNEYNWKCPVHGGEVRAEYEFGRYRDAVLITHYGCECCVVHPTSEAEIHPDFEYYKNFQNARSRVSMIKQQRAAYLRFVKETK